MFRCRRAKGQAGQNGRGSCPWHFEGWPLGTPPGKSVRLWRVCRQFCLFQIPVCFCFPSICFFMLGRHWILFTKTQNDSPHPPDPQWSLSRKFSHISLATQENVLCQLPKLLTGLLHFPDRTKSSKSIGRGVSSKINVKLKISVFLDFPSQF